jgi:predicted RNA binding protein YcfA (HicA-like mRNA interferase family)
MANGFLKVSLPRWKRKRRQRRRELWFMKIREILRQIEDDGWFLVRTRGSHRQYHHATKPGTVTVAGHPGQDLHPKTLNSILKQAGLK